MAQKVERLPPPWPFFLDEDERIVQETARVYETLFGERPPVGAVAPYRYYGSDARHFQHLAGMKGLVFGVGRKYNTMPDERVEISKLHAATRRYLLTTLAICG